MSLSNYFDLAYMKDGVLNTAPSIVAFSVEGGATRTIRANSGDQIIVSSEFEQARKFKNILLFIPESSDNGLGMRTAVDMIHYATTKSRFYFQFSVTQRNNATTTYSLLMEESNATVTKPPRMTLDNALRVEFSLPKLSILYSQGEFNKWTAF